jgi:ABC-2 type transport system permease protein
LTTIEQARHRRARSILGAFIRIDYVDDFSYPASFVLSELAIVVPVITSFFVGELTVGSENAGFYGTSYFTFAVVGLALTGIMQTCLAGFGFSLQRAQERGTLETLLVEPVPWILLPLVMNIWRTLLAVANGLLVLVIGAALGAEYDLSQIGQFLVIVLLGILASQSIGIVSASFLVLAKKSSPIIKLYNLAATLLAGAVFSVDQLPEWLRWVSFAIPQTYVVTAGRSLLMSDPGSFSLPIPLAAGVLLVFTVIVGTGGLFMFNRSLEYARKMGMLSGY